MMIVLLSKVAISVMRITVTVVTLTHTEEARRVYGYAKVKV